MKDRIKKIKELEKELKSVEKRLNEVNMQDDVYFDQLGDVIDKMVDRDPKFYYR